MIDEYRKRKVELLYQKELLSLAGNEEANFDKLAEIQKELVALKKAIIRESIKERAVDKDDQYKGK